jgi:hypothetical protein
MKLLGIVAGAAVCCALASTPTALADAVQYVRTQSSKVRCVLYSNFGGAPTAHGTVPAGPIVMCQASAPGGFNQFGYNLAIVDAGGNLSNLCCVDIGGSKPIDWLTLTYGQTYNVEGWTIAANSDGTRFTNNGTGHGMFVSIENVYAF